MKNKVGIALSYVGYSVVFLLQMNAIAQTQPVAIPIATSTSLPVVNTPQSRAMSNIIQHVSTLLASEDLQNRAYAEKMRDALQSEGISIVISTKATTQSASSTTESTSVESYVTTHAIVELCRASCRSKKDEDVIPLTIRNKLLTIITECCPSVAARVEALAVFTDRAIPDSDGAENCDVAAVHADKAIKAVIDAIFANNVTDDEFAKCAGLFGSVGLARKMIVIRGFTLDKPSKQELEKCLDELDGRITNKLKTLKNQEAQKIASTLTEQLAFERKKIDTYATFFAVLGEASPICEEFVIAANKDDWDTAYKVVTPKTKEAIEKAHASLSELVTGIKNAKDITFLRMVSVDTKEDRANAYARISFKDANGITKTKTWSVYLKKMDNKWLIGSE